MLESAVPAIFSNGENLVHMCAAPLREHLCNYFNIS
jgi:hypothetical protein